MLMWGVQLLQSIFEIYFNFSTSVWDKIIVLEIFFLFNCLKILSVTPAECYKQQQRLKYVITKFTQISKEKRSRRFH